MMQQEASITVIQASILTVLIKHQQRNIVDNFERKNEEKAPCNEDPTSDKSSCIDKALQKFLIERYGCTTPFGPDKDNICTNKTIGKQGNLHFFLTPMNVSMVDLMGMVKNRAGESCIVLLAISISCFESRILNSFLGSLTVLELYFKTKIGSF